MKVDAVFLDGYMKPIYDESWGECMCDIADLEKEHGQCIHMDCEEEK